MKGRHDTQTNDTQLNGILHYVTQNNGIQHNKAQIDDIQHNYTTNNASKQKYILTIDIWQNFAQYN